MHTAGYATADASVPANAAELDRRYGARVEAMLAHWLDDETLAAGLRRPVLAAVARNGQRFDPELGSLEDWIFSEVRREARALIGPEGVAGVIPVMRHSPDPGMLPRRTEKRRAPMPQASGDRSRRRIWPGVVAAALVVGVALAVAHQRPSLLEWQVADLQLAAPTQPQASLPPTTSQEPAPVADPPMAPMPAPRVVPALPKLDAEAEMGRLPEPDLATILPAPESQPPLQPLLAPPPPAPPATVAPPAAPEPAAGRSESAGPPATARPLAPPALVQPRPARLAAPAPVAGRSMPVHASPRVFIHYSALDTRAAGQARLLAQLVRDQGFQVTEIRAVPFQIGEPSVRYFFADNLVDADALVELSRSIPPMAGLARSGPTDFTHFQPKPQPGTLEIWLPAG